MRDLGRKLINMKIMLRIVLFMHMLPAIAPIGYSATWSHTKFYSDFTPLYEVDDYCIECCETRSHGHLVVLADVIDDDCVSSSVIPSSSTPMISSSPFPSSTGFSSSTGFFSTTFFPRTTPDRCICCERRTHGHVVIIAEIHGDPIKSTTGTTGMFSTPIVYV